MTTIGIPYVRNGTCDSYPVIQDPVDSPGGFNNQLFNVAVPAPTNAYVEFYPKRLYRVTTLINQWTMPCYWERTIFLARTNIPTQFGATAFSALRTIMQEGVPGGTIDTPFISSFTSPLLKKYFKILRQKLTIMRPYKPYVVRNSMSKRYANKAVIPAYQGDILTNTILKGNVIEYWKFWGMPCHVVSNTETGYTTEAFAPWRILLHNRYYTSYYRMDDADMTNSIGVPQIRSQYPDIDTRAATFPTPYNVQTIPFVPTIPPPNNDVSRYLQEYPSATTVWGGLQVIRHDRPAEVSVSSGVEVQWTHNV